MTLLEMVDPAGPAVVLRVFPIQAIPALLVQRAFAGVR
jgi:hypothetical protein